MIDYKNMKYKIGIRAILLGLIVSSCSLEIEETDSLITEGESAVFNGVENPAGESGREAHVGVGEGNDVGVG